jgi:hypothetical protein
MRIERHNNGPRVYLLGLRLHHGLTGALLCLAGFVREERHVLVLGLLLIADDAHDFPWRLRERLPHREART